MSLSYPGAPPLTLKSRDLKVLCSDSFMMCYHPAGQGEGRGSVAEGEKANQECITVLATGVDSHLIKGILRNASLKCPHRKKKEKALLWVSVSHGSRCHH